MTDEEAEQIQLEWRRREEAEWDRRMEEAQYEAALEEENKRIKE